MNDKESEVLYRLGNYLGLMITVPEEEVLT